jgi:hypothetical protein
MSSHRWEQILDITVGVVVAFSIVIGFILTVKRRNFHPLKQRSFVLLCATPIISLLFIFGVILRTSGALPCNVSQHYKM